MKRFLAQLFSPRAPDPPIQQDVPRLPERPFVAIGDLHGRADLLFEINALLADLPVEIPLVFVGDYIDRGDDSRRVLEMLSEQNESLAHETICLQGNHEEMCLAFLDNPEANGKAWLRYGGLQTLASFGVSAANSSGAEGLVRTRDALALAMGDRLIDWLRNRPLTWQNGNITVTHAGADPDKPMAEQSRRSLLWGHPDFTKRARADGQWIVHGHTIVDAPQIEAGRIALDTGAYATGHLTAALFEQSEVTFLQTGK